MYHKRKHQQGYMIIMAMFIIVVMGMLALNLMQLKRSNQSTLTREYLGMQAWFLSHSAGEWALTQMYPLNESASISELESRCTALNQSTHTDTALNALANNQPCSKPKVSCVNPNSNLPPDLVYFQITTTAQCGTGYFQVQRGQQIWVRSP